MINSRLTSIATLALAIFLPISSTPIAYSQSDNNEEIFQLSPFTVDASGDRGYRASRTLAGTRLNSKVAPKEQASPTMTISGATIEGIEIGDFSKFSTDTSIRIRFAIGFYDDEEKVRRDTLNRYLDTVAKAIESKPGLIFEPGAILVPEGDKGWSRSKNRSDFASLAHFTVSFSTEHIDSPFEKARSTRRFIGEIKLDSKYAKIFYGEANLVSPHQGTRPAIVDMNTTISGISGQAYSNLIVARPNVPAFLVKKADSLKFSVTAKFRTSSKEEATANMNTFLDTLKKEANSMNALKVLPNVSKIAITENLDSAGERIAAFHVFTNVTLFINLNEQIDAREQIFEIKRLISTQAITQKATTLEFSTPSLAVSNPDKHRSEILKTIAMDTQLMDGALGEDFGVEFSLIPSRVQVWQHSDTEIQFWLPYSQNVVSKRLRKQQELQQAQTHEIAMKDTRPQIVCCEGKGLTNEDGDS